MRLRVIATWPAMSTVRGARCVTRGVASAARPRRARRADPRGTGALGDMALLLTVLGTYVVAQSMVVRRRRELGIRAALGARGAQLRQLVLRDTARLVGIGLAAGLRSQ